MPILELIGGILLLVCCVVVVFFVSLQTEKNDGLAGAIMGGEAAGYRTKSHSNEEKLAKLTRILAIAFFVLALLVNVFVLLGV
ncbi:MAG: preprotein translocase subunit SecG [Oscillospiraceae bacterium]|nr:preprotein translocase subunit SecG [Oscillospiraceae bacterium]MBQ9958845.1 preprotein translocase subunit SecG [Oscillospiraceae bacterium]